MVKVKPVDKVVEKWKNRASVAAGDYKDGVLNPKRDWAEATAQAEDAWKKGLTDAMSRGAYVAGVKEAGTDKWKKKASTVGATRFSDGVSSAVDEYKKKISEVLSILEGIELPPRGARGSEQNYERVKIIGKALHEYRTKKA